MKRFGTAILKFTLWLVKSLALAGGVFLVLVFLIELWRAPNLDDCNADKVARKFFGAVLSNDYARATALVAMDCEIVESMRLQRGIICDWQKNWPGIHQEIVISEEDGIYLRDCRDFKIGSVNGKTGGYVHRNRAKYPAVEYPAMYYVANVSCKCNGKGVSFEWDRIYLGRVGDKIKVIGFRPGIEQVKVFDLAEGGK